MINDWGGGGGVGAGGVSIFLIEGRIRISKRQNTQNVIQFLMVNRINNKIYYL